MINKTYLRLLRSYDLSCIENVCWKLKEHKKDSDLSLDYLCGNQQNELSKQHWASDFWIVTKCCIPVKRGWEMWLEEYLIQRQTKIPTSLLLSIQKNCLTQIKCPNSLSFSQRGTYNKNNKHNLSVIFWHLGQHIRIAVQRQVHDPLPVSHLQALLLWQQVLFVLCSVEFDVLNYGEQVSFI